MKVLKEYELGDLISKTLSIRLPRNADILSARLNNKDQIVLGVLIDSSFLNDAETEHKFELVYPGNSPENYTVSFRNFLGVFHPKGITTSCYLFEVR